MRGEGLDFEAARRAARLEDIASNYTTLNRHRAGPCPICRVGKDRFFVFRGGLHWGCRGCPPAGQKVLSGDVVDLLVRVEGITPTEAVARLIGGRAVPCPKLARPEPTPTAKPASWRSANWQSSAGRAVAEAKIALTPQTEAGQYLLSRGITPDAWQAFCLGSVRHLDRQAVLIPWIDAAGHYIALKYRFCDARAAAASGERFSQRAGSEALVFGANLLAARGETNTLVICEGELNSISIWLATQGLGYDVLSVGPQANTKCLPAIAKLIFDRRYARVVAWFDEPAHALCAASALPSAVPMRSPMGMDANDVLTQRGRHGLVELIEYVLAREGDITQDPDDLELTGTALYGAVCRLFGNAPKPAKP